MIEDQIQVIQDLMDSNSDIPVIKELGQMAIDYLNSL